MQKTQRRVTVLCLMSYLPRVAHAHKFVYVSSEELGSSNVYRLPINDSLSRWIYQSAVSECGDFKSEVTVGNPAAQALRGVAMVVSDVRDDHRGVWRSPSRDVAEPIAARKCKNNLPHSLSAP